MLTWSEEENIRIFVKGADKIDNNSLSVDCSKEAVEESETEAPAMNHDERCNKCKAIEGSKRGNQIVTMFDQRNASDKNSAHARLRE